MDIDSLSESEAKELLLEIQSNVEFCEDSNDLAKWLTELLCNG